MVAGFVRGVPSPRFDFSISTGTQLEDPRHTAQRFHSRFGIEGKRERSIDERGPLTSVDRVTSKKKRMPPRAASGIHVVAAEWLHRQRPPVEPIRDVVTFRRQLVSSEPHVSRVATCLHRFPTDPSVPITWAQDPTAINDHIRGSPYNPPVAAAIHLVTRKRSREFPNEVHDSSDRFEELRHCGDLTIKNPAPNSSLGGHPKPTISRQLKTDN